MELVLSIFRGVRAQPNTMRVLAWTRFMVAMFGFGVVVALLIQSGLGLPPWDAFHLGLHKLTGITVGTASILVGVVIVAGTWWSGERLASGTIVNMVMIGVFIDVVYPYVPAATHWYSAFAYYITAIALAGIFTGLYISTGLGKGPRDGLVVVLSRRSGWPVRRVRTAIEIVVLAAGWAMGGTIGIGTLLFSLLIGPSMQWGLQLFRVLPARAEPIAPAEGLAAEHQAA